MSRATPSDRAALDLPTRQAQIIEAIQVWGLGYCAGSAADLVIRYPFEPDPGAALDRALVYLRAGVAAQEPRVTVWRSHGHDYQQVDMTALCLWDMSVPATTLLGYIARGDLAGAVSLLEYAQNKGHLPTAATTTATDEQEGGR